MNTIIHRTANQYKMIKLPSTSNDEATAILTERKRLRDMREQALLELASKREVNRQTQYKFIRFINKQTDLRLDFDEQPEVRDPNSLMKVLSYFYRPRFLFKVWLKAIAQDCQSSFFFKVWIKALVRKYNKLLRK